MGKEEIKLTLSKRRMLPSPRVGETMEEVGALEFRSSEGEPC